MFVGKVASRIAALRKTFTFKVKGNFIKIGKMEYTNGTSALENYEEAVAALNSLQSNAAVLEKARLERDKNAPLNVLQTAEYLKRTGISIDDFERAVAVVHVAGTKGKGSTCAFVESILRHHGLKTGFYSSPHLIEVRERIRVDGRPLTRAKFSQYFWEIYHKLMQQRVHEHDMPSYFKFLTVMSFYVFLHEKVDVAVMEVGIGGLYDCTNILRQPAVVGITTLGLDHISILGSTVEKIAVHKAGIMKRDVPAFTANDQPGGALQVLIEKSKEVQCPLYVVPSLDSYPVESGRLKLGISGRVQERNASSALQLSYTFLEKFKGNFNAKNNTPVGSPFLLTSTYLKALEMTRWPGRFEVIPRSSNLTYYLDGAHTAESIAECAEWFKQFVNGTQNQKTVLLFNVTGDRNTRTLMEPLSRIPFDLVIFCPNIIGDATTKQDQMNLMVTREHQTQRCHLNRETWLEIQTIPKQEILVLSSLSEAYEFIEKSLSPSGETSTRVLITGSLHLVGGFLSLLEPAQSAK